MTDQSLPDRSVETDPELAVDGHDGHILQPYEVFRTDKDGDPMVHGGSVMAPDPELARHYAREMYSRRQESVRLWIVPRSGIDVLEDLGLLQPPLDRSFKKPGGYVMREKLAAARERSGQAKASGGWRRGAPPPTSGKAPR